MVSYAGLYRKMEEKIAECREKYEKVRENPYQSHVVNSELETLEALYERTREEGPTVKFEADLKNRLNRLEEEKEREDAAPSFSWYGEHYHYLVLEGKCDAYQCMIGLLQENRGKGESI